MFSVYKFKFLKAKRDVDTENDFGVRFLIQTAFGVPSAPHRKSSSDTETMILEYVFSLEMFSVSLLRHTENCLGVLFLIRIAFGVTAKQEQGWF